jgi:hypothetical protein
MKKPVFVKIGFVRAETPATSLEKRRSAGSPDSGRVVGDTETGPQRSSGK